MQVLLLEDDVVMQELLAMLVRGVAPSASVHVADTVEAGLEVWRRESIDLLLCDWNLPGQQTGLELVKQVRAQNSQVPIVMITGQGDRKTVVNSLRFGVNEFVVKPFDPELVALRLSRYLSRDEGEPDTESEASLPELGVWVADLDGLFDRLSIMSGTQSVVALLNSENLPSVRDLTRQWQKDPAITTRLVHLANSGLMRRYGKSVSTLLEAVGALGVDMSVSQVVALSLNDKRRLEHAYLKQLADQYAEETGRIAEQAATLAQQLNLNIALSYTAGLMARLGEQALLDAIQHYVNAGGNPNTSDIDAALAEQATRYGKRLKIKWHLPLGLRERVDASHNLPSGTVNPELILMRLAVCQVHGDSDEDELGLLRRRLGL